MFVIILILHLSPMSAADNQCNKTSAQQNCSVPNTFLHFGKTGGTFFTTSLSHYRHNLAHVHHEDISLKRVCGQKCVVFFVRDPIDRWISGYYSRYRHGCPSHCSNWTQCEEEYFTKFPTVNSLAEALTETHTSTEKLLLKSAHNMVNCVGHLWRNFAFYLKGLKTEFNKIGYVGLTDNMTEDFQYFIKKFNFTQISKHTFEKIHPNLSNKTNVLSEKGRQNLINLLVKDYYYMDLLFDKGFLQQRLTPKPIYYY
jgi:hypothetical protein